MVPPHYTQNRYKAQRFRDFGNNSKAAVAATPTVPRLQHVSTSTCSRNFSTSHSSSTHSTKGSSSNISKSSSTTTILHTTHTTAHHVPLPTVFSYAKSIPTVSSPPSTSHTHFNGLPPLYATPHPFQRAPLPTTHISTVFSHPAALTWWTAKEALMPEPLTVLPCSYSRRTEGPIPLGHTATTLMSSGNFFPRASRWPSKNP